MFTVTVREIIEVLHRLPNPDDVLTTRVTIPLPWSPNTPARHLTFAKLVLDDGDEWMLEHTPLMSGISILWPEEAPTFEDVETASDAEFDRFIDELVVEEQQELFGLAEGIVVQMDADTAETVSGLCFDHILKLEADIGDDVGCVDERDGAPLTGNGSGEALPEFEEVDTDYFAISAGIRAAQKAYNIAVFNAKSDAGIDVKVRLMDHGLLDVMSINLELAL